MSDSILALETATPHASLAVWRDGGVVFAESFTSDRAHNSLIFAPLQRALVEAAELRCLVVGTGPGSYTGVRIGIAAALGISLARKVPLLGLPTLFAVDDGTCAVVGDARRGTWHFTAVNKGTLDGPHVGSPEQTASRCAAYSGKILTFDAAPPPFCAAEIAVPSASRLAKIAAGLSDAEIALRAAQPVEPLYLAAPFVTTPRGKNASK